MLKREIKIKENGKATMSLNKKINSTVGKMSVDNVRLSLSEIHSKRLESSGERGFILSVVQSNKKSEYKISQINCDLQELKQIRNLIDNMINEEVELDISNMKLAFLQELKQIRNLIDNMINEEVESDISNMKLAFEPGVFRALLEGNHIE